MELTKIEKTQNRLRMYRNHLGKSQNEMGEIAGIGLYYGNIERGGDIPSDSALVNIADKLGIDPNWLLDGTGESPIPERDKGETPKTQPIKESKRVPIPEILVRPKPIDVSRLPEQKLPKTKTAKLGDYLLWNGKLAKVVGEVNYNSIQVEILEPNKCPHCGGVLEPCQFNVIPTSPFFQECAKPVQTIE